MKQNGGKEWLFVLCAIRLVKLTPDRMKIKSGVAELHIRIFDQKYVYAFTIELQTRFDRTKYTLLTFVLNRKAILLLLNSKSWTVTKLSHLFLVQGSNLQSTVNPSCLSKPVKIMLKNIEICHFKFNLQTLLLWPLYPLMRNRQFCLLLDISHRKRWRSNQKSNSSEVNECV